MEIFECASSKKLFLNVHIVLGISSSLVTGELNENFPTWPGEKIRKIRSLIFLQDHSWEITVC